MLLTQYHISSSLLVAHKDVPWFPMSAPEMFGGQIHNLGDPQNVRSVQNSLASQGGTGAASSALDLKCYGNTSAATTEPPAPSGSPTTGQHSHSSNHSSNNSTPGSPPILVGSSPSPTEQPASSAEPENLSVTSAAGKELQFQQPPHLSGSGAPPTREIMDTGRITPMPVRDMHLTSSHHDPSSHPPPSMLGPSSIYQPFSAVRSSNFYPIEHYFPHPVNHPSMEREARQAPLPPPIVKSPPPR